MKTTLLLAFVGAVAAGAEKSNPSVSGQQNRNEKARPNPMDNETNLEDLADDDVDGLTYYWYNNWDPLSAIDQWFPDWDTMWDCDADDDDLQEAEMLQCVIDNSPWWAEWYIPYYFSWVFDEYDADENGDIDVDEMDDLYWEIARRKMVNSLISIKKWLPHPEDCANVDADYTWTEWGVCWKAATPWW